MKLHSPHFDPRLVELYSACSTRTQDGEPYIFRLVSIMGRGEVLASKGQNLVNIPLSQCLGHFTAKVSLGRCCGRREG